jgi:hypothetical protein
MQIPTAYMLVGVISPKGRLYGEPHRLRELSIYDPGFVNRFCELRELHS